MKAFGKCPRCGGRITVSDEELTGRTGEGVFWMNCGGCGHFQELARCERARELEEARNLELSVRGLLKANRHNALEG